MAKPHQVFISYASKNSPFANRLTKALKQHGIRVWIDKERINGGTKWKNEIATGLKESDCFLLVLTPEAMRSAWVRQEYDEALAREKQGKTIIIPLEVVKADYDFPFLGSFQWIDFGSFTKGLKRLIDIFGIPDNNIEEQNEFSLPYQRNPYFIGQNDALQEIKTAFEIGKPVGLVGAAGIGKTQIAVKYAYTYQYSYPDGVYWINASPSLEEGLLEIAEEFDWEGVSSSPREIAYNVWNEFSQKPESLVIIDNLRDAKELADYLQISSESTQRNPKCKVLFTAGKGLKDERYHTCSFIGLSSKEAVDLLLSHSSAELINGNASEISNYLERHPLSLSLIAAYLSEVIGTDLHTYWEKVKAYSSQPIMFDQLPENLAQFLSAILHFQWELLDEEEQYILKIASLFRESRFIPLDWLNLCSKENITPEKIEHIHQLSLLEELANDRVSLHTLIHQFVSAMIPETELESFQAKVENNLIEKLTNNTEDYDRALTAGDLLIGLDWETTTLRKSIITALWEILENEEISEPERREVGFKLLELRWPNDQELISGEELLIYLELINRYVVNVYDVQFLIGQISYALNLLELGERTIAHLNIHLGVLNYRLSNIYNGVSKANYQIANSIINKLKDGSDKYLPNDYKLEARILLGMGNLARDYDKDLELALEYHTTALESAKYYSKDYYLLINASKELSRTLSLCEMWDEADEVLLNVFDIFEDLEMLDPYAYAIYSSMVSENATLVQWDKGKIYSMRFARNKENKLLEAKAIRSYLLAYDYSNKAIAILKGHKLNETLDMIYAQFNAAECLKSLYGYRDHKEVQQRIENPINVAKNHWQEVIRIANLLGFKDFEQEARKYLEEATQQEDS